jgi:hypothetical protein
MAMDQRAALLLIGLAVAAGAARAATPSNTGHPSTHVIVPPGNTGNPSTHVIVPPGEVLPPPPPTCSAGYVLRLASAYDNACVTPQSAAIVRSQQQNPNLHRSANGGKYGPDTCMQGYVWREAVADDHVCVTPADRARAAQENDYAFGRIYAPLPAELSGSGGVGPGGGGGGGGGGVGPPPGPTKPPLPKPQ